MRRLAGWSAAVVLVASGTVSAQGSAKAVAWAALTVQQQQALDPLKRDWEAIAPTRQQTWLDVAARFGALSQQEQERIQQRMTEWTRMSPEQRNRARVHFQELRQIDTDERRARWEAYQALPAERRKELARQARPAVAEPRSREDAAKSAIVPAPAAPVARAINPAVIQAKPGASTSLVSQPPSPPAHQQVGLPKITAKPGFVDANTLLPRRGVQGAAVAIKPDTPPR
jgi:hypothetical protein